MCLLTMMAAGTSLRAQEVTVVLNPGWTWISIPSTEIQDFATALGSFTPAVGDIIQSQWGSASYLANGQWRGTISQFYPGYGYMYKSTRTVPVTLTFNPQQPAPQVVVTTSEPMDITGNSAMGGGNVTVSDGTYILVKGLCWATHENPTTNEDSFVEEGSGVGSFTASMTGLNTSTTYYYRAYAVTANSTVYGEQQSFTTRDGIPTLTTAEVTNVQGATATCGGNITDNGGLNITARGVCWSTSPDPTVADSHTTNGSGTGSFSSSITGLNVSTIYYVRAYATTAAGTAYGEEKTFTTRDGVAVVTTDELTDIGYITATCGGTVTDDGGLAVTARGVCWSISPNPTIADSHTTNGNGTGSFSSSITGLNVSTTYYVRAYATNSLVTVYGDQQSFTTLDLPIGAINGLFSVSASQHVYFSQGNLQYQASTNTWRFADNQYDYVGSTNSNISSTYSGWIDLFGWGTSGWNSGNTYYHPWDSNNSNGSLYGPPGKYDLTGSYANADWGVYNPISNGGNTANQWRTLTLSEWNYVFNTRTTTSGIRYAKANVNNVNGVILLPDDWSTSTYSLSSTNTSNANFSSNTLTASQWSTLEQAGAVFLPAAGIRYGTSVIHVGSQGYYWSASHYSDGNAYHVYFHYSNLFTNNDYRYYGQSVRLVRVAEN